MPSDTVATPVGVPGRRAHVAPVPVALRRAAAAGRSEPVRAWSPLGTVDGGVVAHVDPTGAVQLVGRRWSFDWWVGAEDRWHHASTESAVRQQPIGTSPAVSTSLRVPGGDVVQRVAGARATAGSWRGDAVVVEIENATAVPVALALVVRPWVLDGPGTVREVELEGEAVRVDGRVALLLSRPPARVVAGADGDASAALVEGRDEVVHPEVPLRWRATDDRLEVALVLPLPHTAVARVVLPVLDPEPVRSRFGRRARRHVEPDGSWEAPSVEAVVAGWAVHGDSDARVDLPVPAWTALAAWAGTMVRLAGPGEVTRALDPRSPRPAGPPSGPRLAAVARCLAGLRAEEAADAVAAALVGAQRFGGRVEPADGSDATVALLDAAAVVLRDPRRRDNAEDLVGPVAAAVHALEQLAAGDEPGEDDPVDDAAGAASALRSIAPGLVSLDQPDVAAAALDLAATFDPVTSGATLTDGSVRRTRQEPSESTNRSGGVRAGGSTVARAVDVRALVRAGDPAAADALARLLADRTLSGRSDAVDDDGRSIGVLGFDVVELAEVRLVLLDAVVADAAAGPLLFGAWSPRWRGAQVEAHGVPTAWGRVSCALRWHGERPALLWEVEPWFGGRTAAAPVLSAPVLDPSWTGSGWEGEALLAPLPATD